MKHQLIAVAAIVLAAVFPTRNADAFPVIDTDVLSAIEEDGLDEWGRFLLEFPLEVDENVNSNLEVNYYAPQELALEQEEKAATTGPRQMSVLARTPESYIPLEWRDTLKQLQGPSGELEPYQEIYAEANALQQDYLAKVGGAVKQQLDRQMVDAAAGAALNATVYQDSGARLEKLNELADSIEEAEDPKAIWDLTARIGVENAMLTNELIRLQAMNAMVDNRRRTGQQQAAEQSYSLTAAEY